MRAFWMRYLVFACISYCGGINTVVAQGVLQFTGVDAPRNAPAAISFKDENPRGGVVQGTVEVLPAIFNSDITFYVLYWATADGQALPDVPAIAYMSNRDGSSDRTSDCRFEADQFKCLLGATAIPSGATHLLARSGSQGGEKAEGALFPIFDYGVPITLAPQFTFDDEDNTPGIITGSLRFTEPKPSEIADVTHWELFWGDAFGNRLLNLGSIAQIPVEANIPGIWEPTIVHKLQLRLSIPASAETLVLVSGNAQGVMNRGTFSPIQDLGRAMQKPQGLIFLGRDRDEDGGELAGDIKIIPPADTLNITHYALFWGSSPNHRLPEGWIDTLPVTTKDDLGYRFELNTLIPSEATHILAYAQNHPQWASGVMRDQTIGLASLPASWEVIDVGAPPELSNSAVNASSLPSPNLKITPINSTDTTGYAVYWGIGPQLKYPGRAALAVADVDTTNIPSVISIKLPKNLTRPLEATHFLVKSRERRCGKPSAKTENQAGNKQDSACESTPYEFSIDVESTKAAVQEIPSKVSSSTISYQPVFPTRHHVALGWGLPSLYPTLLYQYRKEASWACWLQWTQFSNGTFLGRRLTASSETLNRLEITRQMLVAGHRRFPFEIGTLWEGFYWGGGGGLSEWHLDFRGTEFEVTSSAENPFEASSQKRTFKHYSAGLVLMGEAGVQFRYSDWQLDFGFQVGFGFPLQPPDFEQIPEQSSQRKTVEQKWTEAQNFSQLFLAFGRSFSW